MRSCFLIFAFLVLLPAQSLQENPILTKVKITVGSREIEVEVARTPQELSQGMMFRRSLSDNAGMIFCLLREERASFWMKNVQIPLSVAYMDRTGKILEIYDLKPFETAPVFSRSDKIYYALEMNQGWFVLNGVKVGDVVKVKGKGIESLRAQ